MPEPHVRRGPPDNEVRNVYKKKWTSKGIGGVRSKHEVTIIEATSPTNPGDSGGPCFNDKGEQVGVTQGGLVSTVAQGFSYFVDTSDVKSFFDKNRVAYNVKSDSVPDASADSPTTNVASSPPSRTANASPSKSGNSLFDQFSAIKPDDSAGSPSSGSSGPGAGKVIAITLASLGVLASLGFLTYLVIAKSSATNSTSKSWPPAKMPRRMFFTTGRRMRMATFITATSSTSY